ncbi:MAG: radical SAM protein [Crenarchaeota archaeon]|nr:radical SAM protein [Thermoproteota archaeon]
MTCADKIIPYSPCVGDCTRCPAKHRAVIYGPVQSRRRGRSLGVNLFPLKKVCSFDCIYCLRGRTIVKIDRPDISQVQVNIDQVINILKDVLNKIETDTVDLSGNGEPTLYPYLEELCSELRKLCDEYGVKSLGIFTNSSTLKYENILRALRYVDHIEAKLDVSLEEKFKIINRPCETIKFKDVIEGLMKARKNLNSELAIQILLLRYITDKGELIVNYSEDDAYNMANILQKIEPDIVNIYTVYRPVLTSYKIEKPDIELMRTYSKILENAGLKVRLFIE